MTAVDTHHPAPHPAAVAAHPAGSGLDPSATPVPEPAGPDPAQRAPRATWPLWCTAAGVLGFVATFVTDQSGSLEESDYLIGAGVVEKLESGLYHVGVVAGFLTVVSLLFAAAGWRRWAAHRAPDSLPARVVPLALQASAAAMIIGYGLKGSMAVYLSDGLDGGTMALEGLYPIFMFLDLGAWMVWWGGAIAAAVSVWLAFRDRLLPRWVGALGGLCAAVFLGMLFVTGLPGMAAIATIWLAATGIGLSLSRRFAAATAPPAGA